MSTVLTTDHPAWQQGPDGTWQRPLRSGNGLWQARLGVCGLDLTCTAGAEDDKPTVVVTDPGDLPATVPSALLATLRGLGPSVRIANPWLWDAITTAILRQVVRADQARKLYRTWCTRYGTSLPGSEQSAIAPDPEKVLALTDDQFATVGTKFHRTALRAAATAYLDNADSWKQLPAAKLADALLAVERIGPWTASAAAADYTGDFAVYPHADLAVRTWAAKIAPDHRWPTADKPKKTEALFGTHWHHLADDGRHLHTLTLSTLTWGAHGRTAQPGGHRHQRP